MIIMGVVTLYHSLIIAKDATKYNTFFEYQAMTFGDQDRGWQLEIWRKPVSCDRSDSSLFFFHASSKKHLPAFAPEPVISTPPDS